MEGQRQRMAEQEAINEAEWEKSSNWKLGVFYYSERDTRPWVPKRSLMGRRRRFGGTPNFARRSARLHLMIMIGLMALVFLLVVALENSGVIG